MFTVNDVVRGKYQNGTLGVITMLQKDQVFVRTDEGSLITVKPHEYKAYSYKITGGALEKKEVGNIKQIPLKVAAAITIHKSQGKTFDRVVISPEIFAAGQLYVALSRVRTPEGLILTGPISVHHLKQSKQVEEFYNNGFKFDIPKKKEPVKAKTSVKKAQPDSKKKEKSVKKKSDNKKTTTKATKSKSTASKNAGKTAKTTQKIAAKTSGKKKTSSLTKSKTVNKTTKSVTKK